MLNWIYRYFLIESKSIGPCNFKYRKFFCFAENVTSFSYYTLHNENNLSDDEFEIRIWDLDTHYSEREDRDFYSRSKYFLSLHTVSSVITKKTGGRKSSSLYWIRCIGFPMLKYLKKKVQGQIFFCNSLKIFELVLGQPISYFTSFLFSVILFLDHFIQFFVLFLYNDQTDHYL